MPEPSRRTQKTRFHRLLGIFFSAYSLYVVLHFLEGHNRAGALLLVGTVLTGLVWLCGSVFPRKIALLSHLNLAVTTAILAAHSWNNALLNDSPWFLLVVPLFAAYQLGSRAALIWTGVVTVVLFVLPLLAAHFDPQPEWLLSRSETNRNRILLCWIASAVAVASARSLKDEMVRRSGQEARVEAMVQQAAQGVLTLTHTGLIETSNPSARSILGPDAVGRPLTELVQGFQLRDGQGEGVVSETVSVLWSAKLLDMDHPKIWSVMLTDISQLKKAEEQVVAREAQLREVNERLQKKNEDLDLFASAASHDLRAPLRRSRNVVELLKEEYQFEPEVMDWLDSLGKEVTQAQTLIKDLLSLSRLESEFKEPEELALQGVLQDVVKKLGPQGRYVTFAENLPVVTTQPVLLRQLFSNLVENGLKYNAAEKPVVEVAVKPEESHWLVSVKDNGLGIEPEYQDKIFEPFRRLHTSSEYSGSGLGLAICRRISEALGGRLWVMSEQGQGSIFYFTLPRKEAQSR